MDGIVINGQKVVIPGVSTQVDASALAGKSPATRGYVACLYEADRGGEPKVPYIVTSSAVLRRLLPAREATIIGKLAFEPSKDDQRIPRGAAAVVLVRANPAVRAALQLADANAVDAVSVEALDWGNYGNDIIAEVAAGTSVGKKLTLSLGSVSETFDNIGSMDAFTVLWDDSDLPGTMSIQSMLGYMNPLATGDNPAFYINVKLRVPGGTAEFDPRAWMAFDGNQGDASNRLKFTVADQGSTKEIVVTGTRRDTGATVTDTIEVLDNQTTAYSDHQFSEISAIDVSALSGNVDIEFSAFNLTAASYKTIAAIVDRIVSKGRGFEATFDTTRRNLAVTNLDYDLGVGGAGNDITGTGHTFAADLYHFVSSVTSNIAVLSRVATGRNVPAVQGPSNLTGGVNGTASAGAGGDWDQCLTAIRSVAVSHVTARTGEKPVHALINDHVTYMCGAGKDERIAILGAPAGTGKDTADTGLYARTAALNSRNVALCAQEIKIYDENGEEIWVEPFDTAILAAACDAGANAGDSVTHALVDILAFRDQPNHGTAPWNTVDDTAELITHGVMLLGQRQGSSLIEWIRDVPTYQTDDNPIFCSVFANESLNYSNKNLRRHLEVKIGRGNRNVSENSLRSWALKELRRQKEANEINNYDPKTVQITSLGNGFTVDYKVAPLEAIYWISQTAHVQRM